MEGRSQVGLSRWVFVWPWSNRYNSNQTVQVSTSPPPHTHTQYYIKQVCDVEGYLKRSLNSENYTINFSHAGAPQFTDTAKIYRHSENKTTAHYIRPPLALRRSFSKTNTKRMCPSDAYMRFVQFTGKRTRLALVFEEFRMTYCSLGCQATHFKADGIIPFKMIRKGVELSFHLKYKPSMDIQ